MSGEPLVRVANLVKDYDGQRALDGVSFELGAGGVVALLGPNGAGKTTLVEILEGLRAPSAGTARVFGLDPATAPARIRERIGVQLQATELPQELQVREVLRLFAAFYPRTLPTREVLERVDLIGKERQRVRHLSGGERQKLALALALQHEPELLLLDEPTSALDPMARRGVHEIVRRARDLAKTVLITTHYIEEAEKLCDRVLVLRRGELVADGTPFDLVARAQGISTLWLEVEGELDLAALAAGGATLEGHEGNHLRFVTRDPAPVIVALGQALERGGATLRDLRLRRPTLEDVYLDLVGQDESEPAA